MLQFSYPTTEDHKQFKLSVGRDVSTNSEKLRQQYNAHLQKMAQRKELSMSRSRSHGKSPTISPN
jgi:hypothetical protein